MSNQFITITPDITPATEFVQFTQTYNIAFEPTDGSTYDYVFYDVVPVTEIPKWCSYSYTKISDMSFSLTANLGDVFDRTIKYISNINTYDEVKRFSLIPSEYKAVYSYTGTPAQAQTNFAFHMRMRPSNIPFDIVQPAQLHNYTFNVLVNADFNTANQKMSEFVKMGSNVKYARDKGFV